MPTKTKKPSASMLYERIATVAETIKNDEPATVEVMSPGDNIVQGDIYLDMLDVAPEKAGPHVGRQLAPGTTQGSRHVVTGDCDLYTPDENSALSIISRLVPATADYEQLLGPVILARGPVTIEHPEHGHRTLPPGIYLTTYQRAWADEVRRQED